MPHVLQRTLDPRVTLRRILLRHADDKSPDLEQHPAPSGLSAARPFPRDQLPMPAQQGVRRRDRGDLPQGRSARAVCSCGQPSASVIGGARAAYTAGGGGTGFLRSSRRRPPVPGGPASRSRPSEAIERQRHRSQAGAHITPSAGRRRLTNGTAGAHTSRRPCDQRAGDWVIAFGID